MTQTFIAIVPLRICALVPIASTPFLSMECEASPMVGQGERATGRS